MKLNEVQGIIDHRDCIGVVPTSESVAAVKSTIVPILLSIDIIITHDEGSGNGCELLLCSSPYQLPSHLVQVGIFTLRSCSSFAAPSNGLCTFGTANNGSSAYQPANRDRVILFVRIVSNLE